jgi:hypothetical protein
MPDIAVAVVIDERIGQLGIVALSAVMSLMIVVEADGSE